MIVSDHDDLMPTPLEVRLFVAAIKRPLVAALVLGLPFGLFNGGLGYAGIHPFQYLVVGDAALPAFSPKIHFIGGWFAGAVTVLIHLSKPY